MPRHKLPDEHFVKRLHKTHIHNCTAYPVVSQKQCRFDRRPDHIPHRENDKIAARVFSRLFSLVFAGTTARPILTKRSIFTKCSVFHDDISTAIYEIRYLFWRFRFRHRAARIADCHRPIPIIGKIQTLPKFGSIRGRKYCHIRNGRQIGNVKNPLVRVAIPSHDPASVNRKNNRKPVQADVMEDLVICTL